MKKILPALILLVGLTPAWADWVFKGSSDVYNLYIKPNVMSSGGTVKGWVMLDRRVGRNENIVSSVQLFETRCNAGQMRTLQSVIYNGQMGLGGVNFIDHDPDILSYPTPGTLSEAIFETLCSQK
jgi:hypothetical protein